MGNEPAAGLSPAVGGSSLPINEWSHIAATFDGSLLRIYVNGSEVNSAPGASFISPSNGPLSMGGHALWSNENFAGRIDDVRVYNRALAEAEIQADMATPVDP